MEMTEKRSVRNVIRYGTPLHIVYSDNANLGWPPQYVRKVAYGYDMVMRIQASPRPLNL